MPERPDPRKLFEECVASHADSMYRVAWRLTGDSGKAEDLVQETYSQAWQKIESLRDVSKIRSWMFAILRNQNLKTIRKNRPTASPDVETVVDHRSDETEKDEKADIVQSAIEQLDEDQRLPILLVSMEGLSVEEASEILGVPKGTVLSRMHRGRKRLKEILSKEIDATG